MLSKSESETATMAEPTPMAAPIAGVREVSVVNESPFSTVDTEAQFDQALAYGRWIVLRGEGSGGVVTLTTTKEINAARTVIQGPGHLRFTVPPAAEVRCLWVSATDVTLRDFEVSSTRNLSDTNEECINIPGYDPARSHRLKVQRLDMHNWHGPICKWGGDGTPYTEDILIEDCYIHAFHGSGIVLSNGVRRATVRRCRVLGKQTGETHTQLDANGFYTFGDSEDVLLEDSVFGGVLGMGIEISSLIPGTDTIRPKVIRCRVEDVGRFGVSLGHAIQGYAENVRVKRAKGIGIEIAGNPTTGIVKDMLLIGCDVQDISDYTASPLNYSAAYAITGTDDTIMLGCRATNITSDPVNESNGAFVSGSNRSAITNCIFRDAGATAIQIFRGDGIANTGGYHVVQGCVFRHSFNLAGATQRSVYVSDTNAVVRLNTTFQKAGGSMVYSCNNTPGAFVWCDAASPVTGVVDFQGSNNIIGIP